MYSQDIQETLLQHVDMCEGPSRHNVRNRVSNWLAILSELLPLGDDLWREVRPWMAGWLARDVSRAGGVGVLPTNQQPKVLPRAYSAAAQMAWEAATQVRSLAEMSTARTD